MKFSFNEIEELLPGYLSGDLSDEDRIIVDEWRKESPENEAIYSKSLNAWEAIPLLHEMEQFNSFDALNKVNTRLVQPGTSRWWGYIYRIAAILLLPLLVYSGYLTIRNFSSKAALSKEYIVMQTVSSHQGMVTRFSLSDGTRVWLNSGSELQFPIRFNGAIREVKLKGQALFEVTKNEKQPFRVNAKSLKIDVLGTIFNVVSYDSDDQAEVTLVKGKIKLSSEKDNIKKEFGTLHPGQRSVYKEKFQKVYTNEVNVDKYIAWKDGKLIFNDDSMENVAKQLSRWFNVEIVINDPEIKSYIYKATFHNENIGQVLNLLKLSAPIDYRIIKG